MSYSSTALAMGDLSAAVEGPEKRDELLKRLFVYPSSHNWLVVKPTHLKNSQNRNLPQYRDENKKYLKPPHR